MGEVEYAIRMGYQAHYGQIHDRGAVAEGAGDIRGRSGLRGVETGTPYRSQGCLVGAHTTAPVAIRVGRINPALS